MYMNGTYIFCIVKYADFSLMSLKALIAIGGIIQLDIIDITLGLCILMRDQTFYYLLRAIKIPSQFIHAWNENWVQTADYLSSIKVIYRSVHL